MQQPFCKFITFLWGGGLLDMKDFKTFVYCQEIITILDLVCRKEVAGKNYFVCVGGPQRLTASVKYHMGKWHLT